MKDTGLINSIQTLGAVDGPGVRFVVFLQGCPLRCVCCHNPETQEFSGGRPVSAGEITEKVLRYREYFGEQGGITLSGGEPLMQPEFAGEIFRRCRQNGIHTCLDTSGCILNDRVKELLEYTDLVLLDIKYTSGGKYRKFAGCDMSEPLAFLDYLESREIPVWIRQVIIPGLNDDENNIILLKKLISGYKCVGRTELLPFKKMCEIKYEKMGREFPLKDTPEPSPEEMKRLEDLLSGK